jgi:DNA-directed RNA polymerase subunit L
MDQAFSRHWSEEKWEVLAEKSVEITRKTEEYTGNNTLKYRLMKGSRVSSVGIATDYGLEGPGFDSR